MDSLPELMHSLSSGEKITASPNRNNAARLLEWRSTQHQHCDWNFDAQPTGLMHRRAGTTHPDFLREESTQHQPCDRNSAPLPTGLTQQLCLRPAQPGFPHIVPGVQNTPQCEEDSSQCA
ncbi:hypothetical protein NDU88_004572 [Pleurodeles waltl]|uniref:Uncharacterized protein n=1 Tax=Pleurodeles waltl TaxID=8319 RepID=A0AAV7MXL3_PLEWA|nr:hypothetical protein NDU88_004572 [Pleurodeles waltl]